MATDPRPETILGVFGEGYCKVCHFIEALDKSGLIISHTRGFAATEACKGTGKKPPRLTPYLSKLAAFQTEPPRRVCGYCLTEAALTPYGVFGRHWKGSNVCLGTSRRPGDAEPPTGPRRSSPLERDHSNERPMTER